MPECAVCQAKAQVVEQACKACCDDMRLFLFLNRGFVGMAVRFRNMTVFEKGKFLLSVLEKGQEAKAFLKRRKRGIL